MRALARLFASDVRYGLLCEALPRLAVVAAVSGLVFFLSYTTVLIQVPGLGGRLTFGEGVLCMFRGMLPYVPESGKPFQFPMAWLALLVSMAYVAADYPLRDLGGMGARMIVASGSRWAWWLSKCAWAIVCAFVCCAIPLAMCALATLVTGGDWSVAIRPGVATVLRSGEASTLAAGAGVDTSQLVLDVEGQALVGIGAAVAVLPLSLAAILLVQMLASLLVHPVVGLMTSVAVLFFSAYFRFRWLPGEYLMLARTDALMRGGMHPWQGALLGLGIIVAAVLAGGLLFARRDILGRGGEGR